MPPNSSEPSTLEASEAKKLLLKQWNAGGLAINYDHNLMYITRSSLGGLMTFWSHPLITELSLVRGLQPVNAPLHPAVLEIMPLQE